MAQIATIQIDVKLGENEVVNTNAVKVALLEQLPTLELSKANIVRVRSESALGEGELVEGLVVNHEKYGNGIILEKKESRKYPLSVIFASGKMLQFTYDAQFQMCSCEDVQNAIHPNRKMSRDKVFVDVGTVGYIRARGKGEIMVIIAPTRSLQKYKAIPVISKPSDYKGHYYTIPSESILQIFKEEPSK